MVKVIDRNEFGLRTAVVDLAQPEDGRRLKLLGMVHIGDADYYRLIQQELDDCDVVFFEGVKGWPVWWITLSYRIPTWLGRWNGLVQQRRHIDLDALSAPGHWKSDIELNPMAGGGQRYFLKLPAKPGSRLGAFGTVGAHTDASTLFYASRPEFGDVADRQLIHADISEANFMAGWREIGWRARFALLALAPVAGLILALSKTFRDLAFKGVVRARTGQNVEQPPEQISEEPEGLIKELQDFKHLVVDKRDAIIVAKMEQFWTDNPDYRGQAAGIYGAGHLPAIIAHFTEKHGFKTEQTRWVTAIAAD